jgi:ribonucleoside-diphosphate reductase alpha chain
LLGSFNLVKYVTPLGFDFDRLRKDIPIVVRAMDNVVERARYPLAQQKKEALTKRRMGLGVTALANAVEALGHPYGSDKFVRLEGQILQYIMEYSYQASARIAGEKGSFKLFDKAKFLKSKTVARLSQETKRLISRYGMRNSHLTSIAPTGTISLAADNVSSGIEPVFSHRFDRTIITFDGPRTETVEDYGVMFLGTRGKTASECTMEDHLRVLIEAYKWTDSAVSKTCNVNPKMPWEDFKQIYQRAWESGCKGCTTFNPGGKRTGILVEKPPIEEKPEACFYDPNTGTRSCE